MRFFPWLRLASLRDRDYGRLSDLEKQLGHRFRNRALLQQALTHRSVTDQPTENLERLEFLGDAILEHVVSIYLFRHEHNATEGELTTGRSALVNKDYLAEAGEALGLQDYLNVEAGVRLDDSKVRRNLVGDATESVIGAIYLDAGFKVVERFILRKIVERKSVSAGIVNHKGQLIELCHEKSMPKPRFHLLETRGPEHDKKFIVEVRMGDESFAAAESDTKKTAEQAAAKVALDVILNRENQTST